VPASPLPTPPKKDNSIPIKQGDLGVVTQVYKLRPDGRTNDNEAAINDSIIVVVKNFKKDFYVELCSQKNSGNCTSNIFLNLDGRKLNISPETIKFGKEETSLQFHLERRSEDNEIWSDLLGNPGVGGILNRQILVSISLNDGEALPIENAGKIKPFKLIRLRWFHLVFWIVSLGVILIIIKNKAGKMKNFILENSARDNSPFSLGRTQMAWWFFWVITSYIYVYMVNGSTDTLNDSVLGLIGIGAATSLGAAIIDIDQPSTTVISKGFWIDLLSSRSQEGGLYFHRLQLIIWTFVLTVIFLVSVYSRLSMPAFSPTLLALQGITSGVYLGFKFPENK
jgi:hypothetical protein